VNDEGRDKILAAVVKQSRDTHFLLEALVELLIERKVLTGKTVELLEHRAAALSREAYAKLLEDSKKLPHQ